MIDMYSDHVSKIFTIIQTLASLKPLFMLGKVPWYRKRSMTVNRFLPMLDSCKLYGFICRHGEECRYRFVEQILLKIPGSNLVKRTYENVHSCRLYIFLSHERVTMEGRKILCIWNQETSTKLTGSKSLVSSWEGISIAHDVRKYIISTQGA